MKVKEESEKFGLKLNIQKTKIMASSPITSCQRDGETVEIVTDFILWPPDAKHSLIGEDPDAGRDRGLKGKGTTEDEMVGWYYLLNGHASR